MSITNEVIAQIKDKGNKCQTSFYQHRIKSAAEVSITNEIIAQIKDKGNNSKPPPDRQSGSLLRQTTRLQACMWTRQ